MAWMADTADRRADPHVLWPQVRSVVMVGLNYGPDEDPRAALAQPIAVRSRSMPAGATITT